MISPAKNNRSMTKQAAYFSKLHVSHNKPDLLDTTTGLHHI